MSRATENHDFGCVVNLANVAFTFYTSADSQFPIKKPCMNGVLLFVKCDKVDDHVLKVKDL